MRPKMGKPGRIRAVLFALFKDLPLANTYWKGRILCLFRVPNE